jgi:hypothetical protein
MYDRKIGETIEDYQIRICGLKESSDMTWQQIADIINSELGFNFSESKYRKDYAVFMRGYAQKEKEIVYNNNILQQYNDKILELKKEKVKLSDERKQNNAYIYNIARIDVLREIARDCALKISETNEFIFQPYKPTINGGRVGILQTSDWHLGEIVESYLNNYNTDILINRLNKLVNKIIDYCTEFNLSKLYVINLGDLISGLIHLKLRLETRENVIEQTIKASELMANILYKLSKYVEIEYYSVLDNHSRVEADKKDSISLESFAQITQWYLATRFDSSERVHINNNEFDEETCTFEIFGYNFIGVHGHLDPPSKVVSNLSMMTGKFYNVCLTAHLHHFNCDEQSETIVVSNGAVIGTNNYAKDLRAKSKSRQNLILVSRDNPCEAIFPILLN